MFKHVAVDSIHRDLLFRLHTHTYCMYDISTVGEKRENGDRCKWVTMKYTTDMTEYAWVLRWNLSQWTMPLMAEAYYIYDFIFKMSMSRRYLRDWKLVYMYDPSSSPEDGEDTSLVRNNGLEKRHKIFHMMVDSPIYLPDGSVCCLVRYARGRTEENFLDSGVYHREKLSSITYSLFWIRNECDYEVIRSVGCSLKEEYKGYEDVIRRGYKEMASKYMEFIDYAKDQAIEMEDIPLREPEFSYLENVDYLGCDYNPMCSF